MKTKIKVEDFFREWVGTRPNLNTAFHEAGIEAMAFAEAYHKTETKANGAEKNTSNCNIPHVSGSASERYRKALGYISEMTFEIEIGTEKGSDVLEKALRIASGNNVE